jgi:glycosyltransferase involved in cell wall biosynthesis
MRFATDQIECEPEVPAPAGWQPGPQRRRPRIAFFDYADVFEDFYPHYGVDQDAFAHRWAATGNHRWVSLLQSEFGDVTWYSFSLAPTLTEAWHEVTGARVRILRSPPMHRLLWRAFYLPRPAWRWQGHFHKYELAASYASLASVRALTALRSDAPDLLFLQDYSSGRFDMLLLAGRLLGVPVVAYHGGGWRWVAAPVKRRTLRRADLLLASSRRERDRLVSEMGVSPERVPVVLTPIDLELFHPQERHLACREAGLDPARRHLLFVGRLDDNVKRVSLLIRAFSDAAGAHPDASLVIAGDGPDRERLERVASEVAPGRVTFVGWTESAALPGLLNAAECLVLPSRREGFPTVVGEALACGTPVLGSRVGGIPELVIPGITGWLVEPDQERELAAAIRQALDDPGRVSALRPAARSVAQRHLSPAAVAAALREHLPLWAGSA